MLTDRSRTGIAIARFGRTRLSRASLACSGLAMAVALSSAPAHAQFSESFQGSAVTTFGNAAVTTGPNSTTVTVNSPSAVIDWTPFDTATGPLAINWQPTGTTATFTGAANYAVLNRIIPVDPTRAIVFDGVVNSLVGGSPGGTVFFFSPGGIVLSVNSQFNVGNLGLTSSAPVVDAAGNWYTGNQVQFQASAPGRMVNTLTGSQITAPAEGSYVALVAPSISHNGAIDVNGQAALVSADAATITFNPTGLFDIQVTSGTSATGNTLSGNGSITGPASSGTGDNHRIYAVAVPKNDAITMLFGTGSQLGFDIAGAADVVGNSIVLSGGRDITAGVAGQFASPGGGTGVTNVQVFNSTLTSALNGSTTGTISLFSTGGGTTTVTGNVALTGTVEAEISSIGAGSTTTINGGVNLSAIGITNMGGANVTAGTTEIFANTSGLVTINGSAFLNSSAFGGGTVAPGGTGGSATGGLSIIQALTGGDIVITGAGQVNANAIGGSNTSTSGGNGGAATGGRAQIFARDAGSSVTIGGIANARANGTGGASGPTGQGGSGTGGIALINAQAAGPATVSIGQAAVIQAVGSGGGGFVGGAGTGGTASAAASDGNTVTFNQGVDIGTPGVGGNGSQLSGTGTGGTSRFNLFNSGTINVATNATVMANGFSGNTGTGTGTSTGGLATAIAQQNSVLDINGNLQVATNGGSNGVPGANATGGSAIVGATGGSRVDVAGVIRVRADGSAGNILGTMGSGGTGSGGNAQVFANTGGDVLANELNLTAIGLGGADTGSGAGSGTGGTASLFATDPGSTITVANGNSTGTFDIGELEFMSTHGFGGDSNGGGNGRGGNATGGTISITASNGAVLTGPATTGTQGLIRIIARGLGGDANTGAIAGGDATGGTINILVDNATFSGAAQILPSAFAQAGSASATATGTINGGNAIGGSRNITVNNGGTLSISSPGGTAGGQGGNATLSGRGGDASGGSATLTVDNNSTLNLAGNLAIFTTNSPGTGLNGGNATGGNAFARIANGSTVNQTGPATNGLSVSADAVLNIPGTGPGPGTGNGGTLTAGTSTLLVENATLNVQNLVVSANANADVPQFYIQGTNATGGTATFQTIGSTTNVASLSVSAGAAGGTLAAGQNGVAGTGTGGLARIIATGGTSAITSAQAINVGAGGVGGNIEGAASTSTGVGIGGRAALGVSNGASLTLNAPSVNVEADGEGGEAVGPSNFGGDGIGGQADVFVNGGNLTVNGDLTLEADNDGGEGLLGGDGLLRADGAPNVLLRAENGNIAVTGITTLSSVGEGDSGGSASGGLVIVDAQNSLTGPSRITLNTLVADATASGGAGASAPSPTSPGGDGGDAFGGNIQLLGSAGNGTLVVGGTSFVNTIATGGAGGTGHPGATGTTGGRGGDAIGGFIQFGTKSGALDTGTVNTGSAQFAQVQALSNAFGGAGGAGGSGTTQGNGGAGGDAFGGAVTLLVRGSPVTLTAPATLGGDAVGGAGGAVAVQGAGGNATVGGGGGGVAILATSRFMQPTQLGTLTAPGVFGTAFANGGSGSTPGASIIAGEPLLLQFDGASGTIGDISLEASGTELAGSLPSLVSLTRGQLDIGNSLTVRTGGTMTVALDRFVVNVPTLTLQAANFILPATVPVSAGTFNVSSGLGLFSDLDFLTYANFNVPFDTSFSWAGDFRTGDFTGGKNLFVDALGSITMGDIEGNEVGLFAGASVATGSISASESIELEATGTIASGALVAGDVVDVSAGGAVNIASASAGIVDPSTNPEAEFVVAIRSLDSITTGDLASKGSVGVGSPGAITVGNVTTGNAGLGFLALAGTGLTTGSIDTSASLNGGRVYLANFSMEPLGGEIANEFDPAPLLAVAPVAIGGPISIGGPVTTGIFQAATTQDFTSAAITASSIQINAGLGIATGALTGTNLIDLTAGASLTFGDITTSGGLFIDSGGSLTTGNVQALEIGFEATQGITTGTLSATSDIVATAGGAIQTGAIASTSGLVELDSGGALTSGTITAGQSVTLDSGGTLTVGNINAGEEPEADFSIALLATGTVNAGNLTGTDSIGLLSRTGAITAQTVGTGGSLLALANGAVNLGGVTTASTGTVYIANASMVGLGGPIGDGFNPAPIFAAAPVAVNGAITLGGPLSSGTLSAAATGNFTAGNLTLGQRLTIGRAATAQVNGNWTAPTISVASQRLQFGTEGTNIGIGGSQTTSLSLRALASQQTAVLGGTTRGEGYTLTQADFGRIRTSNLTIQVDQQGVSSSARDLEIRDLTLNGSGMSGGLSMVSIGTPGSARITGDLVLQQAGAMDRMTVSGGQRLEIVLPDASVGITGTGGALAGTLTLSSNNLVAGTLDLLMQVMADPEAAGLADALATPASTTSNLDGYIRANSVSLISNANILLQNSGTARDFAGVTTGGGGLIIGRITPMSGSSSGGSTGGSTGGTSTTSGFSFTGMLVTPNDVLMFQFTVDANSEITLRTYSYAGGTNAAGQVIPAGGFDPILALFDSAGALIGQNDDGGSNVPADPVTGARFDTFFQPTTPLAAGTYTVTVSVFPNFAVGPNLSNGFENDVTSFGNRTANFAFDVLGASVASGPGTQTPSGPSGPLNVIGFGRQQTATGSITGEAFFTGINFGRTGENPLLYSDISQFNTCLVSTGVCSAPTLTMDPVASISSEVRLAIVNALGDAPVPDVIEEAADSQTESADEEASQSSEEEDEAEADAASPIAPPTPLINTRPLNPAVSVVEPVAGAGNPALIGSAVNEGTAQGDTP